LVSQIYNIIPVKKHIDFWYPFFISHRDIRIKLKHTRSPPQVPWESGDSIIRVVDLLIFPIPNYYCNPHDDAPACYPIQMWFRNCLLLSSPTPSPPLSCINASVPDGQVACCWHTGSSIGINCRGLRRRPIRVFCRVVPYIVVRHTIKRNRLKYLEACRICRATIYLSVNILVNCTQKKNKCQIKIYILKLTHSLFRIYETIYNLLRRI